MSIFGPNIADIRAQHQRRHILEYIPAAGCLKKQPYEGELIYPQGAKGQSPALPRRLCS
jgi:hypothetical protein